CWRQWRAERVLAGRGVHFRSTDPAVASAAYAAMSSAEFDAINARQNWANWRTIPRALKGRLPDRALFVVDLRCGTGSSTRVLADYCPIGSRIVGLEQTEPLLDCARRRVHAHSSGRPVTVEFVCQSVSEPFREPNGQWVPECSVDLVNASGIIGHHF